MKAAIALAAAALAAAGAALALPDLHPRDPREAFTAADQAWAKQIALRRSDLPAGWRGSKPAGGEDPRCPSFDPDLSDLTLTGESESLDFERGPALLTSNTQIFRSAAEAATSFRRGAKPQLVRCYDDLFREEFMSQLPQAKIKLISGRVVAAPPVGERRFAVRLAWEVTATGTPPIRIHLDVFGWDRGRVSTAIAFFSTLGVVPDRALEARIAKRLDARMRE